MEISELREKLNGRSPVIMETKKASSVLIPIVEKDDELCLLFETRTGNISQPGEVCFPGGAIDPGERPDRAAVREVFEELGLPEHKLTLFGEFDTLHTYTGLEIHTFVGQIAAADMKDFVLQPAEVANTFIIPISYLLENPPFVYTYMVMPDIRPDFPYDMVDSPDKYNWRTGTCTVPIWNYQGHCLWGMTARIVRHFLKTFFELGDGEELSCDGPKVISFDPSNT